MAFKHRQLAQAPLALAIVSAVALFHDPAWAQSEEQASEAEDERSQGESEAPSPAPEAPDSKPLVSEAHVEEEDSAKEMRALREEMKSLQAELRRTQEIVRADAESTRAPSVPPPAEPVVSVKPHAKVLADGAYYLGGTFGANFSGKDNIGTLFGTVDEGSGFRAKVSAVFGRVLIEDNLGLGLTVRYEPENRKSTVTGSSSEPSKTTELAEYSVTAGPAVRQYLPLLGDSLFVFYQAAVTFGYAERVERVFQGDTSSVVSANGYSVGLDVQPGLMVAASDSFTIEVAVNVLGLDYTQYKTTTDYETVGTEHKGDFTADVNLLSLQFSFVGYF